MSEPQHAGLAWRKSSASSQGPDCVEVAHGPDFVYVRNSRHDGGPVLAFLYTEWDAFVAGVRNGEFDLTPPVVAKAD